MATDTMGERSAGALGRRTPETLAAMPESGVMERLDRIVAGDRAAAQWLYDRFAPPLHRRLRSRYPDLETDDLLHDAFVFLFQRRGKVLRDFVERRAAADSPCREVDLERYLWDLACGVASNRRRTVWARRVVPLVGTLASRSSVTRELVARESLQRLERCLSEGAPRTYLYFQLRYRDGLRPAEISRATGWSVKRVYKLGERFVRALAGCVQRLGLGGSP